MSGKWEGLTKLRAEVRREVEDWKRFKNQPHIRRAMKTGIVGILTIMGPIFGIAYPSVAPQYLWMMAEDVSSSIALIVFISILTVVFPVLIGGARREFGMREAFLSGILRYGLIVGAFIVRKIEIGEPLPLSLLLFEFPIMVVGYCLALRIVEAMW
jgi:hypothetical protein